MEDRQGSDRRALPVNRIAIKPDEWAPWFGWDRSDRLEAEITVPVTNRPRADTGARLRPGTQDPPGLGRDATSSTGRVISGLVVQEAGQQAVGGGSVMQTAVILSKREVGQIRKLATALTKVSDRLEGKAAPAVARVPRTRTARLPKTEAEIRAATGA